MSSMMQFSYANEDELLVGEFLRELSRETSTLLCNNERFLKTINKSTSDCLVILTHEYQYCEDLIRIFVPKFDSEDDDEVKDKLFKINMLHLSCLKGNGFERALSK